MDDSKKSDLCFITSIYLLWISAVVQLKQRGGGITSAV